MLVYQRVYHKVVIGTVCLAINVLVQFVWLLICLIFWSCCYMAWENRQTFHLQSDVASIIYFHGEFQLKTLKLPEGSIIISLHPHDIPLSI